MTDAAHLLSDVSGFAVALFAGIYAAKKGGSSHSFGYAQPQLHSILPLATLILPPIILPAFLVACALRFLVDACLKTFCLMMKTQ